MTLGSLHPSPYSFTTVLLFHLARCCGEQVLFQSLMHEEFKVDKTFSHLLRIAVHATGFFSTPFFFITSFRCHDHQQWIHKIAISIHFPINTQNHHKDEACLSHSPNPPVISPSAPGLQQLPCTPCFQGCAEEAIDLEIRCFQGHGAIFPTLPRWPGWVCKGSDSQYLSSWETERHSGVFRCQYLKCPTWTMHCRNPQKRKHHIRMAGIPRNLSLPILCSRPSNGAKEQSSS